MKNFSEKDFFDQCLSQNGPGLTLSWAQSINGALSVSKEIQTVLSGPESMALVHRARALHSSILVGIGTVLADDPRLNVRLAPGPSPRPIIVAPRGNLPLGARVWSSGAAPPVVVTLDSVETGLVEALEDRGALVLTQTPDSQGRIPWGPLIQDLKARGLGPIMVEGGVSVLNGILQSGIDTMAMITVCPRWMTGPSLGQEKRGPFALREISGFHRTDYGGDQVWFGRFISPRT